MISLCVFCAFVVKKYFRQVIESYIAREVITFRQVLTRFITSRSHAIRTVP